MNLKSDGYQLFATPKTSSKQYDDECFIQALNHLQVESNLDKKGDAIANPVKYGMLNEFHCFGLASRELLAQSLLSEKLKNTRKLYVKISQFCYISDKQCWR